MKLKERADAYATKLLSDLSGDAEIWQDGQPSEVKLNALRARLAAVIEEAMNEAPA